MSLVSITVTGIYQDASEELLAGKVIRFTPVGVFGDDGAVIASTTVRVTADPITAAFSVDLLTSDIADAYVRYQVVFHNGSRRKFDLTDDAPTISLEDLLNAYDPTNTASSSVDWLNHEARIDALELAGPGGGGGAVTFSAGNLSGSRASIVFGDANGLSFGMLGSTITGSHNGITNSAPFRLTANDSQLQFTSANSNLLGTGATESFRHTSADSQLQFTSANSNFLGTAATQSFRHTSADSQLRFTSADSQLRFTSADSLLQFISDNSLSLGTGATASFRHTSADSQLQFTSANSNFLGTAATASFRFTSQNSQLRFTSADAQLRFTSADSQLQFTSDNSLSLGTGATQSFRHTSADSQLQFTSANTNFLGTAATQSFQFSSDNSLSLGTGATASFRFTSQNSQLQFTSANSNFLGTAATQSFRHTSADTQLRFTSADSQLRFTSADTQLQFTSANTKFAQEWMLSGNTSGTSSSVQGSRWYLQGGANMTISGSGQSIVFSAGSAAPSPVNFSAGAAAGDLGSVVFSNSNNVSFGLNGSTITAQAKVPDLQYFELDDAQGMGLMTNLPGINTRPIFVPFILKGNLTNSSLLLQVSRSTSGSNAFTMQAAIYSFANSTSIARMGSLQNAYSGGNTASFSGVRYLVAQGWEAGVTNMTPGAYVLGLNFSANGGNTASMNYSLFGGQSASQPVGFIGSGTDNASTTPNSSGPVPMWGRYSAGSAGLPANVAQSEILAGFTGASAPLAPWFVLKP